MGDMDDGWGPHDQAVRDYFAARPENANPAKSGGYGANFRANLAASAALGHPDLCPPSWQSTLIEELKALTQRRSIALGKTETVTLDDVATAIWEIRNNSRKSASYPSWTRSRWFPDHPLSAGDIVATIRPANQLADIVDLDDETDDILVPLIRDTLQDTKPGAPLEPLQIERLVGFGRFQFKLRPNAILGGRQLLWFTDADTAKNFCESIEPRRVSTAFRDALGLVHYSKGDVLALVQFPATALANAAQRRPSAFDGVTHRRFMLATSRPGQPFSIDRWGQAAQLEVLEEGELNNLRRNGFDGKAERVSRPLGYDLLKEVVLTAQVFNIVEETRGGSGTDVEFTAHLERIVAGLPYVSGRDAP
jgi:hypothetical protein